MTATIRVRIEDIQLSPNVPAGCNPYVLMSLAYMLRGCTDDPPPVLVRPTGHGTYRITDGRHRYLAVVLAGRPDVLCQLDGPAT